MSAPCLPLPKDFLLDDYRIERQLSLGGFSIVYLAYDSVGEPVAIKEYLPSSMAQRTAESPVPIITPGKEAFFAQGMKSFVEEARLLSHIKHPNVVEILSFFKANETAYIVMRYVSGRSLHEYIEARKASGKMIRESFLRNIFVRLLSGLREVHLQKLLHLDLKPANIYLRDDAQPVLLDFGATRVGLGQRDPSLGNMYTPGFAAPEQQGSGERLGPWTDIYSIGATLYACLAWDTPQAAALRMQADELEPAQKRWVKLYSIQLLELIDWCMKLRIEERPQSVFELQKVLSGELLDLVDPSWFETGSSGQSPE